MSDKEEKTKKDDMEVDDVSDAAVVPDKDEDVPVAVAEVEDGDATAAAVLVAEPTEASSTKDESVVVKTIETKSSTTPKPSKKRGRSSPTSSNRSSPVPDGGSNNMTAAAQAAAAAVSAQAVAAAAQAALMGGMTGLSTLLATSPHTMPTVDQVRQAATKAVNDAPPYVHMSSRDSAPQLKIDDGPVGQRLIVRGGMRGYRMARATHGVSEGSYYFEVLILSSPTARELTESLPSNVRLGKVLQQQLQDQLVREEREKLFKSGSGDSTSKDDDDSSSADGRKSKKKKTVQNDIPSVGGHVRIGWSMRTGDLQAPVGYDKWSYGLRDIAGSRVHNSRREDHWGGEPFGPGDVVGFAISLVGSDGKTDDIGAGGSTGTAAPSSGAATSMPGGASTKKSAAAAATATNHIRFFRNGEAMGHFIISKGKREGGAAFENIQDGTYYPAVSSYMGGSVKVNFGPHFVYPPRMLPTGMKLSPMSNLCPPPPTADDALAKALKERSFSKKTDESIVKSFKDAIYTEAQIRHDAYMNHMSRHVEEVRKARQERNISTSDLPEPTTKETLNEEGDEEKSSTTKNDDGATDATVKMDVEKS